MNPVQHPSAGIKGPAGCCGKGPVVHTGCKDVCFGAFFHAANKLVDFVHSCSSLMRPSPAALPRYSPLAILGGRGVGIDRHIVTIVA